MEDLLNVNSGETSFHETADYNIKLAPSARVPVKKREIIEVDKVNNAGEKLFLLANSTLKLNSMSLHEMTKDPFKISTQNTTLSYLKQVRSITQ